MLNECKLVNHTQSIYTSYPKYSVAHDDFETSIVSQWYHVSSAPLGCRLAPLPVPLLWTDRQMAGLGTPGRSGLQLQQLTVHRTPTVCDRPLMYLPPQWADVPSPVGGCTPSQVD